jgi:hypothetical protein
MTRRRGELSAGTIDRDWSHQIALPADQVKSFGIIREFCRALSLCSRGHTVQRDNITYNVFCFADRSHADLFLLTVRGPEALASMSCQFPRF